MILAASSANNAIEKVVPPIADAVSSVVFFEISIGDTLSPSSSSGSLLAPYSSHFTWAFNSSARTPKSSRTSSSGVA